MAIDGKLLADLRQRLSDPSALTPARFGVLQELCRLVSSHEDDPDVQELILRALENRDCLGTSAVILDSLVRRVGLFPYLEPLDLPLRDQLAYEFHRPENFDEAIVFHRPQAMVYRMLVEGKNVALSAPMSFGKSLVIDAVIATGKYKNIVIVVPTIALIDETRRRLSQRFRGQFKVITHPSQTPEDRNIYVLTQERVLEAENLEDVDFFVIDEFYKLSPEREEDERCALLNQAFYRLAKRGSQFYMLGPSIVGLSEQCTQRLNCLFLIEPYHTVVSELHRMDAAEDDLAALVGLCERLDDPTIIFCRSPGRTVAVAKALIDAEFLHDSEDLREAAQWVEAHYHPDWHFAKALRRGVGIHHGRIPRALAQYVVRKFNDETLRFLICTSTLIEGVNTKARNIIILDNKIGLDRIDLFTFNNIRGRAGRMKQHFVGHVYIFHGPPQMGLPFVDVPAYSQPDNAPESLLIQIDDEDLSEESKARLRPFVQQDDVGYDTLRANVGVALESQVALAQTIAGRVDYYHSALAWTGIPTTYEQLQQTCTLIWDHFGGQRLSRGSARTVSQLAFLINWLRDRPTARDIIQNLLEYSSDADEATSRTNDFLRLWASFHFPRLLRALDRIQRDVFGRHGLSVGNYEYFAAAVENLYLDPAIVALDEYGIPLEVGRKLEDELQADGSIDTALQALRDLSVEDTNLSEFEKDLVLDAQSAI